MRRLPTWLNREFAAHSSTPVRYKPDLRARIPIRPYLVHGTNSSTLRCIPMRGELVDEYLHAIHLWDCSTWNRGVAEAGDEVCVSWRDGESFSWFRMAST
jgi:hypothetical protein